MSANSTLDISREDCMKAIIQNLFQASDARLEDVLYDLWGRDHLHNFRIASESDEECKRYFG